MTPDSNRPSRKKVRHYDNGEPHFLTFSCYRRLGLLSKDRTRQWFADALEEARTTHGFHLWAWVIMPEHVHLLLWPPFHLISPDPGSMQGRVRGILSSLKRPVAGKAIPYLRENSPAFLERLAISTPDGVEYRFWQAGSGHDENVSEPVALHALVDYVHLNPVRRGLVSRPEDWPWSSARDWSQLPHALLRVDRTLPNLLELPWTMRRGSQSN
jgi:putative transposase